MAGSSFIIKLLFSIAFVLLAYAQSSPQPTISSVITMSSESASESSSSIQMAWWNKTWDVVVVGSGPAGIIGKIPFSHFPSRFVCVFDDPMILGIFD